MTNAKQLSLAHAHSEISVKGHMFIAGGNAGSGAQASRDLDTQELPVGKNSSAEPKDCGGYDIFQIGERVLPSKAEIILQIKRIEALRQGSECLACLSCAINGFGYLALGTKIIFVYERLLYNS